MTADELALYADRGFVEVHDAEGRTALRATEQSACRMLLAHAALLAACESAQVLCVTALGEVEADNVRQAALQILQQLNEAVAKARGK